MFTSKQLIKVIQNIFRQMLRLSKRITKQLVNMLMRFLLVNSRDKRFAKAGFVLPTVVMVILVVVLVTSAIVFRSFDRAKNISNYRVNQQVINSALPAIDRAKAKISALFDDPNLPRGTPSELAINNVLTRTKYKLSDETQLRLAYDFGNGAGGSKNNSIQSIASTTASSLAYDETATTAWRFPIDSDNNGVFDSFTVYGILFRSPNADANGNFSRGRSPIEARTIPMDEGTGSGQCAAAGGTSASLVGTSGWYKSGTKLKKSFFVYVATVPITDLSITTGLTGSFETYKGNKAFSGLEYQQDYEKVPLANNAVLYEDDLDIISGPALRLNGRVFTNSNLLVTELTNPVELFQVSSRNSCFYEPDNSKIVVGGNVGYGYAIANSTSAFNSNAIDVHLYKGTKDTTDPVTTQTLSDANKSVTDASASLGYNNKAYTERINFLVNAAIANGTQTISGTYPNQTVTSNDPSSVRDRIKDRINGTNPPNAATARKEELELYFKNRTRRVPYAEVAYNYAAGEATKINGVAATSSNVQGLGTDNLRPPDAWIYPFDPTDGSTGTNYSKLTLKTSGVNMLPSATEFTKQEDPTNKGKESFVGDRVLIGNNLPSIWYKGGQAATGQTTQDITAYKWNDPTTTTRSRRTRVEPLSDLGSIDRDGFWETKAAEQPTNVLDGVGGLRIITGGGIYLPTDNVITSTSASNVVWPDTMPVLDANTPIDKNSKKRPFLKMRATAVYHYKFQQGTKPIACVSSYYDPTDKDTARNKIGLDDVSGVLATGTIGLNPATRVTTTPSPYKSNNGITYAPPTKIYSDYTAALTYQANLVYPNGRQVNPLLKAAVTKGGTNLTLAEQAAVDSAICSLQIYNNGGTSELAASTTPTSGYTLPHGAIQEIAFLDARQIKAIDGTYNATTQTTDYTLTGNYNLPIEQRQPLEIRATVIDLNALRSNTAGSFTPTEYMLPNSGIVYASRNDALPDNSDSTANLSPSDFKLDPTRRPSGIMLINGSALGRTSTFREVEKGLILASNLPVYLQAQTTSNDFNSHNSGGSEIGEFTGTLPDNSTTASAFYSRSTLNNNFACRSGDPRLPACTVGDSWRAATVLTDSTTLLSSTFREGFRNEGDYDLRNNQTDSIKDPDGNGTDDLDATSVIVEKRLRNGFWDNNFVTSRDSTVTNWRDADYRTTTNTSTVNSSYFNNFVTPIQRRISFPEYIMEICRNTLISECQASDWVVGYDTDGNGTFTAAEKSVLAKDVPTATSGTGAFDKTRLIAGTTALPAKDPADRIYPRRIAFQRDDYNALIFTVPDTTTGKAAAKPYGVDCDSDTTVTGKDHLCLYPGPSPQKVSNTTTRTVSAAAVGVTQPTAVDNSLWFRTTSNTAGDPGASASISYQNNLPVYYLPPELGGTRLILPETPCFRQIGTAWSVTECSATADPLTTTSKVFNLNLPRSNTTNPSASAYTSCIKTGSTNSGSSDKYQPTSTDLTNSVSCPSLTYSAITTANAVLDDMADEASVPRPLSSGGTASVTNFSSGTLQANPSNAAAGKINFVDLDTPVTGTIRLEANGVVDPIFVFVKRTGSLVFNGGVKLQLDKVNPNNIFWVSGNTKFNDATSASPTILAGNFLNSGTATPDVGSYVNINGGRFLGWTSAPAISATGTTITAVTADGQPKLIPVLQLQYPTATSGSTTITDTTLVGSTQWLPKAAGTTTFNMVMATGDNPSHPPSGSDEGDYNGGLANLPHFLENWTGTTMKISGSFIQLRRSAYATAPMSQLPNVTTTGNFFGYLQKYQTGNLSGKVPAYEPPNRTWGYDVGLLSQMPDLFAQQFTTSPSRKPREFFREIGRDDEWLKALLCAKQASDTTKTAINTSERPTCTGYE